ncbi:MAG: AAA family ATPase [Spirochaetes bacterium]|nr:AAA family ATPase [Spirochaetota bacterium]
MVLKKLIVNGFKSFCDHSEITFDKGTSAIVGPNGCGKSNIVDAIKWVIGEQKTRMLRANNMTDVIFKGTEEKRGLGRAEVKLILVNDDNLLPLEYNEIEISRIIYASGENEYYINKERVRLKDIQELFFDTGVGKSAYSFMEQGKIDLILSTKPEDRRYIIEEAAGITRYKSKKDESIAKLKQSDENIMRVKDILKEVEGQYKHMKDQAEKAIRYKELYEKEMNLEIEINLNRISRQKKIRDEFNEKLESAEKSLEEVKEKIDALESTVADKMVHLNELEVKKIDNQRFHFQVESEMKVITSKINLLKDQLQSLQAALKSDQEKIEVSKNKIAEIEEEIADIDDSKQDVANQIGSTNTDIQFYQQSIESADLQVADLEQKITSLKDLITVTGKELENQRTAHREITDALIIKINQSLNELAINEKEIMDLKGNLNQKISGIAEEIHFRKAFIDDILKTGLTDNQKDKYLNMLKELQNSLGSIEEKIYATNGDVKKFIQATEMFVDDIFSPEGVVQQKRQVENQINQLNEKIKQSNQQIEEFQSDITSVIQSKDKNREILSELKINMSTLIEKQNSIEKELERTLSLKKLHQDTYNDLKIQVKQSQDKIEDCEIDIDDQQAEMARLQRKKIDIEKFIEDLNFQIQKENASMTKQQQSIKEINDRWINKKSDVEKLNIKITEATTTVKNIYDSFYENFSINLSEYESKGGFITNRAYEDVRRELSNVRSEKSSLGNVNLMAIEESKILEERYQLLTDQLNDLEEAKVDLLKVIEELNLVSQELFLKTFNQIKINFHKLFRKLFDGGNAEIKLSQPDNVLESGIEITAHPPGQKTQSITLLSGGQRTMTAISLMFATFLVKPSPFCLLDEIDAALDEENVTRFVNLVSDFKQTSQFIIITHNKKTISAADVMYGVTQEQRGVSKIVSAKLINANDMKNETAPASETSA